MEIPDEVPMKKPKRLTSVVWNHFERVRKADACYAVCVHCNRKLSGSSNSGTSHLRNHLMRCLKHSNFDVTQMLAPKRRIKESDNVVRVANNSFEEGHRRDEFLKPTVIKFEHHDQMRGGISTSFGSSRFDQKRSGLDLVRMIIYHGYPLNIVEHVGFKVFVKNLQPLFELVPEDIEHSCMEVYSTEKHRMYQITSKLHSRLSIALETWSSAGNFDCLCFKAYYIDEDWKMQKRILNFVTLDPSYTKDMLPEVVAKCLMEWSIDSKLFALTFDDISVDDNIASKIKEIANQNRPHVNNDHLFDLCCAAVAIKSFVQDTIEAFRGVIYKIRSSFAYAKSSQLRFGKFNEIAQHVGISCERSLVLDSSLHWNSTCAMLETALEYKTVFCHLRDHDIEYKSALTDEEWELTNSIAGFLKLFVDITNTLSHNKGPSANIYFAEICDIHIQLIEWCKNPDTFISSLAIKMKAKFDKYWSKCSPPLAISAILDPRFKMKLVEYYYSQIYGSNALERIKEVSDGIKDVYDSYSNCSAAVDPGCLSNSVTVARDQLKGFDKFLHETSQNHTSSDLDKYLEEPVFPRKCDFNILNWWRVHTPRYPILSMMARDVLSVPISTTSPELAFNSEKQMLDSYQSSLNPAIREALICARDWLQMESDDSLASSSHHYSPPVSIEDSRFSRVSL